MGTLRLLNGIEILKVGLVVQVKLTIMIEDPREVERRKELGIEDDRGCSKEDMALALVEVCTFVAKMSLTTICLHQSTEIV